MERRADASTSDRNTTRGDGSDAARRAKPRDYSGQGHMLQNWILFGGGMITIVVSFWMFASYPNSPWLFFIGIMAYGVALAVPTVIFPTRTAKHAPGGKQIAMHLPAGPHEMAHRPGEPDGAQVNH